MKRNVEQKRKQKKKNFSLKSEPFNNTNNTNTEWQPQSYQTNQYQNHNNIVNDINDFIPGTGTATA